MYRVEGKIVRRNACNKNEESRRKYSKKKFTWYQCYDVKWSRTIQSIEILIPVTFKIYDCNTKMLGIQIDLDQQLNIV